MALTDRQRLYIFIAVAILAIAISSIVQPVKVIVDEVAKPVAETIGVVNRTCPSGWKNTSSHDEHTQILSCEKDGWLVVLDGEGKFQHGIKLDTPGAEFTRNPAQVPGWQ